MNGFVTVLILAVGALCGFGAIRGSDRNKKGLCAAGVVVCAALVGITRLGGSGSETVTVIDRGFETAAGHRLGKAIASDLADGNVGGPDEELVVVVLNSPRISVNLTRQGEAYWDGLREALRDAPADMVRCPEEIAEEAHRILLGEGGSVTLTDIFKKTTEAVPNAGVLVSLIGMPGRATAREMADIPPIYTIESSPSGATAKLLRKGVVRGLVTFQSDTDWTLEPDPSLPWQDLFDQRYVFHAAKPNKS